MSKIRKLNCDSCMLKTEHYLLSDGDSLVVCRCLKCGVVKKDLQLASWNFDQPYPMDESKPVYLL